MYFPKVVSFLFLNITLVGSSWAAAAQLAGEPCADQQAQASPKDDRTPQTDRTSGDSSEAGLKEPHLALNPTHKGFGDFKRNEKAIWTSPLHVKRDDLKWLLPLGGVTAGLFATDKRVLEAVGDSKGQLDASHKVSLLGSAYVTLGVAGSLYAVGSLAHNDRTRETGLVALQALIHGQIVFQGLKLATQRDRPSSPGTEPESVWNKSFPSGHAVNSWALARVMAAEYPDHPLVGWGAYGLATAISISRVTGRRHYPSDVLVGGAIGYLIGDYLVRQQKKSHGIPHAAMITPYVDRTTHTHGLAVSFVF
jgi:membrane-associated phospholipid phosphatase